MATGKSGKIVIPESAARFWFKCGCTDPNCARDGYSEDALPHIVAATLRALAEDEQRDIERLRAADSVFESTPDNLWHTLRINQAARERLLLHADWIEEQ